MPALDELREKIGRCSSSRKMDISNGGEVHAVTFQPLATRQNQDRLVVHEFQIHGQAWLLLAVCDGEFFAPSPSYMHLESRPIAVGHGGASTARYTASHLPSRISTYISRIVASGLRGRRDRRTMLRKASMISSELRRCVKDFDRELGHVVQTICPEPAQLSGEQACGLVQEYPDALWRAYAGTTLAAAVVNLDNRIMWTINVGDSTIGEWC